jgi:uncharacterized Zn finger protein (UPF0148 family)
VSEENLAPREKLCKRCSQPFKPTGTRQIYCPSCRPAAEKEKTKEWRKKNSEKIRTYSHDYYWQHRDEQRESFHDYYLHNQDKLRHNGRLWRQSSRGIQLQKQAYLRLLNRVDEWTLGFKASRLDKETCVRAERLITETVLPREGYVDVFRCGEAPMPFDALARKDNKEYAIEITLSYHKRISPLLLSLCKHLNLDVLVAFVSPSFKKYKILSVKIPNIIRALDYSVFSKSDAKVKLL